MAIYEARGFQNNLVYPFDRLEPFEYIAQFKPMKVPEGVDIEQFKRTQAPYCISGKVTADKKGTHRRNNSSLVYRDLVFLDYDELEASVDFPRIVSEALSDYSYIIYPTIKHTAKKPRYRLVVKPSNVMNEATYKQVVKEIADKIGLPFDLASLTWSQLQGLPVTTGEPEAYQKIIHSGLDYPVPIEAHAPRRQVTTTYTPRPSGQQSITMRVIDTLFNGFGDEGGRNVSVTRFVGLLVGKWVNCDIPTAWELTKIANSVTAEPLPDSELEATFEVL
ncbi:TPA: primase alpha helix C-terminal domain-containing protein [Streptococcus suis]|nr:primase alpha helix C-terminal domain-containing protein [Streptococcus suis]HEM6357161.1 primase alpha helix C-terminal domain-containing protein [Streptococcus suis]HEM6381328.1 primase alpha helix C-terminal domain-containing protein [Streptococcus suis]HEM6410689.1 primase alpha helix C-terminal domain-containing protein [Streptococcus suis]